MQTGTRGKQLAWSISAPPKDHKPADLVSIFFFLMQIKNGKLTSCDLRGEGCFLQVAGTGEDLCAVHPGSLTCQTRCNLFCFRVARLTMGRGTTSN